MKKLSLTLAVAAAAAFAVAGPEAAQAGSVDLNIQLGAYIPAPPGMRIYVEAGRPYYVENHRRVYMKKRHHEDHGRHRGHDRDEHHDRGDGHGKGHGKKHGRD
jgi:hypothetical protein